MYKKSFMNNWCNALITLFPLLRQDGNVPYHIIFCGTKSPSYPLKIIVESPVMNGFLKRFCIISDFIYSQILLVLTRALIWLTLKIAQCTYHIDFVRRINVFLKPSCDAEKEEKIRQGTSCRSRTANTVYREELQQRQDLNSLNVCFLNFWQYVNFGRYWGSPKEIWITLTFTNVRKSWEHLAGHQKP